MKQQLLNSDDVKTTYGISRSTLDRRIKSKDFPQPIKVSGRRYWSAADISRHIASITGGAA